MHFKIISNGFSFRPEGLTGIAWEKGITSHIIVRNVFDIIFLLNQLISFV